MKTGILFLISIFLSATQIHFSQSKQNEDMVLIPAGNYSIGIEKSELPNLVILGRKVPHMDYGHAKWWFGDETPKHSVEVKAFYIDKYEVTNRQFREFIDSTGYTTQGNWEKYYSEERLNHPVVNVTWQDAAEFAKWKGKRLPTENEWEIAAARKGDSSYFPWGNKISKLNANYRHRGESFLDGIIRLIGLRKMNTKPVGAYPENSFGLFDIIGNVSEWCASDYYLYPGNSISEIEEKDIGKKVYRGGNWESPNPVFVRVTERSIRNPASFSWAIGFRCAKSAD